MTPKHPKITHSSQLSEHSTWRQYRRGLLELELSSASCDELSSFVKESVKDSFAAFLSHMTNEDYAPLSWETYEVLGSAFEDVSEGRYPILLVSMPPRTGKTTLGVHLLSWLLGKDPTTSHLVTSCDGNLTKIKADFVRRLVKSNSFDELFSKFEPKPHQVVSAYLDSSLGGLGYGGSDKAPGIWLIDDYHKYYDDCEVNGEWVDHIKACKALSPNSATVVFGSRRGEDDIFGYFLEKYGVFDPVSNPKGAVHINLSAIIESEEEAKVDILGRKAGQGINDANYTFSSKNLKNLRETLGDEKFSWLYKGMPPTGFRLCSEVPPLDKIIISVDPGGVVCLNSDKTGICVSGFSKERDCMYVLDAFEGHWNLVTFGVILTLALKAYKADEIVIESCSISAFLVQYLENLGLPVRVCGKLKESQSSAINKMKRSGKVRISEPALYKALTKSGEPMSPHPDILSAVLVGFMTLLPVVV